MAHLCRFVVCLHLFAICVICDGTFCNCVVTLLRTNCFFFGFLQEKQKYHVQKYPKFIFLAIFHLRDSRPFRTYRGVRFTRSQIYLLFNVSAISTETDNLVCTSLVSS